MELLFIATAAFVAWLYLSRAQGGGSPLPPLSTPNNAPGDAPVSSYSPGPSITDQIAQAIFQMEGNKPGDLAFDNNNPGDLRSAQGQVGSAGGFAVLPDFGTGWTDLENYISSHVAAHPDWDFYDFFQNYLGQPLGGPAVTPQGDSNAYAEYVAQQLGVDPTTPISQLYAEAS